jgi:Fic family protein
LPLLRNFCPVCRFTLTASETSWETLRQKYEKKIMTLGSRAEMRQCLLLALFSKPIMNAHGIAKELNVFFATSTRIIKNFQRIGILKEITGFSRNRSFASAEYLALFMK